MKNPSNLLLFALALAIAALLVGPGFSAEEKGKIIIKPNGIIMYPGAEISKADEKALNEKLKIYDLALYRINTFRDGRLVQTQGELRDVAIDKAVKAEEANFKARGQSHKDIQFVLPGDVRLSGRGELTEKNARDFIDQLGPILAKYGSK